MQVRELIEILLDKCDLDAEVIYCHWDDYNESTSADSVGFVEYRIRDNVIYLYDGIPNLEECGDDIEVYVTHSDEKYPRFLETSYREL